MKMKRTVKKKMKVKEKLIGLFTAINNQSELAYCNIIEPSVMDMLYISNYGERTLSAFATNNSVEDIAKAMSQMFGAKWNKLYDMAISKIDIDYNYSEKQTENVDNSGKNDYTISTTNTGSVNAYNDNDFVNDKQEQNDTKNKGTNSATKKREYLKQVLNGSKTEYYNDILNYLQNNYFNDIIVKDINDFLTLSIFE